MLRYLNETTRKRDHERDKARLRRLHPRLEGLPLTGITHDRRRSCASPATNGAGSMPVWHSSCAGNRPGGDGGSRRPKPRACWLPCPPPHRSDMAEFSLTTGLQVRNVRQPVWSEVDLSQRIARLYADRVKNNTDLTVPLSSTVSTVSGGGSAATLPTYSATGASRCATSTRMPGSGPVTGREMLQILYVAQLNQKR